MLLPALRLVGWLALLSLGLPALAAPPPQAFSARYHLQVDGWPDADIRHRLSHDGGTWQSEMRTELPGAWGREWGRFRVAEDRVRALHYAAGYSLLGIQRGYSLDRRELGALPDRQSALVALARRAIGDACSRDCPLHYRDHRGREAVLRYRVLGRDALSLPLGRFERVRVALTEPGEAGKRLVLDLDARRPGLLLALEYHRDGQRRSRLTLTALAEP
ncbi:hypothetical protein [Halomonas nitroreducens]|uniref:hypothetical protein n=1 Tax=Halomonas nitroreducens TaxID=447425 RepID=UPI001FEAFFD8|nr:hypothetical protein [Halomonas nitroreducens]